MVDTKKRFPKDPDAFLDYVFDWSTWLRAGETISSYILTASGDLVIDQLKSNQAGGKITVWLDDGQDLRDYEVTCHIVTNASREDDRTMIIESRER